MAAQQQMRGVYTCSIYARDMLMPQIVQRGIYARDV